MYKFGVKLCTCEMQNHQTFFAGKGKVDPLFISCLTSQPSVIYMLAEAVQCAYSG